VLVPPSPMDTSMPANEVEDLVSTALVEVLGPGTMFVLALLVGTTVLGSELVDSDVSTTLVGEVGA
jgi:hypothetical protein